MVKILAPVYSSLFFSSSCHLSYCEKNLIKHLKINRFFLKSQTLPDVYPKMNTTSLCVLCSILWTVLSPQRHLCLSACRPPVQLAGPQACDFSAIQLLWFPTQPRAVGTAWAEHEFDSIKEIYIF